MNENNCNLLSFISKSDKNVSVTENAIRAESFTSPLVATVAAATNITDAIADPVTVDNEIINKPVNLMHAASSENDGCGTETEAAKSTAAPVATTPTTNTIPFVTIPATTLSSVAASASAFASLSASSSSLTLASTSTSTSAAAAAAALALMSSSSNITSKQKEQTLVDPQQLQQLEQPQVAQHVQSHICNTPTTATTTSQHIINTIAATTTIRSKRPPHEYIEHLFPFIAETHRLMRDAIVSVNDSNFQQKIMAVIKQYRSGCLNEYEAATVSTLKCRKLARNLARMLNVIHCICSTFSEIFLESDEYLYRMSELVAIYISCELCYAKEFKEHKPLIANRISNIIYKHLKVPNEETTKANILRMFVYIPKMYKEREIMRKIFQLFIPKPLVVIQQELPDELYIQYLIVFYQWKQLEIDVEEKIRIIEFANQYMRPKRTLCTNRMYAYHLPKYESARTATKFLLQNLKFFQDLRNASITDNCYKSANDIVDLSDEESLQSPTKKPNFADTYKSAKIVQHLKKSVKLEEQLLVATVDLTLTDDEEEIYENDWLKSLQRNAMKLPAANTRQTFAATNNINVIELISDSDEEGPDVDISNRDVERATRNNSNELFSDFDFEEPERRPNYSEDNLNGCSFESEEEDNMTSSVTTENHPEVNIRTYAAKTLPEVTNDNVTASNNNSSCSNAVNSDATTIEFSMPRIVDSFSCRRDSIHLLSTPLMSTTTREENDVGDSESDTFMESLRLETDTEFEYEQDKSTSVQPNFYGRVIYSQPVYESRIGLLHKNSASISQIEKLENNGQNNKKQTVKRVQFNDRLVVGPTTSAHKYADHRSTATMNSIIKPAANTYKNQCVIFATSPLLRRYSCASPASSTSSSICSETIKQIAKKGMKETNSIIILDSDDDNDNETYLNSKISTQPTQCEIKDIINANSLTNLSVFNNDKPNNIANNNTIIVDKTHNLVALNNANTHKKKEINNLDISSTNCNVKLVSKAALAISLQDINIDSSISSSSNSIDIPSASCSAEKHKLNLQKATDINAVNSAANLNLIGEEIINSSAEVSSTDDILKKHTIIDDNIEDTITTNSLLDTNVFEENNVKAKDREIEVFEVDKFNETTTKNNVISKVNEKVSLDVKNTEMKVKIKTTGNEINSIEAKETEDDDDESSKVEAKIMASEIEINQLQNKKTLIEINPKINEKLVNEKKIEMNNKVEIYEFTKTDEAKLARDDINGIGAKEPDNLNEAEANDILSIELQNAIKINETMTEEIDITEVNRSGSEAGQNMAKKKVKENKINEIDRQEIIATIVVAAKEVNLDKNQIIVVKKKENEFEEEQIEESTIEESAKTYKNIEREKEEKIDQDEITVIEAELKSRAVKLNDDRNVMPKLVTSDDQIKEFASQVNESKDSWIHEEKICEIKNVQNQLNDQKISEEEKSKQIEITEANQTENSNISASVHKSFQAREDKANQTEITKTEANKIAIQNNKARDNVYVLTEIETKKTELKYEIIKERNIEGSSDAETKQIKVDNIVLNKMKIIDEKVDMKSAGDEMTAIRNETENTKEIDKPRKSQTSRNVAKAALESNENKLNESTTRILRSEFKKVSFKIENKLDTRQICKNNIENVPAAHKEIKNNETELRLYEMGKFFEIDKLDSDTKKLPKGKLSKTVVKAGPTLSEGKRSEAPTRTLRSEGKKINENKHLAGSENAVEEVTTINDESKMCKTEVKENKIEIPLSEVKQKKDKDVKQHCTGQEDVMDDIPLIQRIKLMKVQVRLCKMKDSRTLGIVETKSKSIKDEESSENNQVELYDKKIRNKVEDSREETNASIKFKENMLHVNSQIGVKRAKPNDDNRRRSKRGSAVKQHTLENIQSKGSGTVDTKNEQTEIQQSTRTDEEKKTLAQCVNEVIEKRTDKEKTSEFELINKETIDESSMLKSAGNLKVNELKRKLRSDETFKTEKIGNNKGETKTKLKKFSRPKNNELSSDKHRKGKVCEMTEKRDKQEKTNELNLSKIEFVDINEVSVSSPVEEECFSKDRNATKHKTMKAEENCETKHNSIEEEDDTGETNENCLKADEKCEVKMGTCEAIAFGEKCKTEMSGETNEVTQKLVAVKDENDIKSNPIDKEQKHIVLEGKHITEIRHNPMEIMERNETKEKEEERDSDMKQVNQAEESTDASVVHATMETGDIKPINNPQINDDNEKRKLLCRQDEHRQLWVITKNTAISSSSDNLENKTVHLEGNEHEERSIKIKLTKTIVSSAIEVVDNNKNINLNLEKKFEQIHEIDNNSSHKYDEVASKVEDYETESQQSIQIEGTLNEVMNSSTIVRAEYSNGSGDDSTTNTLSTNSGESIAPAAPVKTFEPTEMKNVHDLESDLEFDFDFVFGLDFDSISSGGSSSTNTETSVLNTVIATTTTTQTSACNMTQATAPSTTANCRAFEGTDKLLNSFTNSTSTVMVENALQTNEIGTHLLETNHNKNENLETAESTKNKIMNNTAATSAEESSSDTTTLTAPSACFRSTTADSSCKTMSKSGNMRVSDSLNSLRLELSNELMLSDVDLLPTSEFMHHTELLADFVTIPSSNTATVDTKRAHDIEPHMPIGKRQHHKAIHSSLAEDYELNNYVLDDDESQLDEEEMSWPRKNLTKLHEFDLDHLKAGNSSESDSRLSLAVVTKEHKYTNVTKDTLYVLDDEKPSTSKATMAAVLLNNAANTVAMKLVEDNNGRKASAVLKRSISLDEVTSKAKNYELRSYPLATTINAALSKMLEEHEDISSLSRQVLLRSLSNLSPDPDVIASLPLKKRRKVSEFQDDDTNSYTAHLTEDEDNTIGEEIVSPLTRKRGERSNSSDSSSSSNVANENPKIFMQLVANKLNKMLAKNKSDAIPSLPLKQCGIGSEQLMTMTEQNESSSITKTILPIAQNEVVTCEADSSSVILTTLNIGASTGKNELSNRSKSNSSSSSPLKQRNGIAPRSRTGALPVQVVAPQINETQRKTMTTTTLTKMDASATAMAAFAPTRSMPNITSIVRTPVFSATVMPTSAMSALNCSPPPLPVSYPATPMFSVANFEKLIRLQRYIDRLLASVDVTAVIASATRSGFVVREHVYEQVRAVVLEQATIISSENGNGGVSKPLLLKQHTDGSISILNDNDIGNEWLVLPASTAKQLQKISTVLTIMQEQEVLVVAPSTIELNQCDIRTRVDMALAKLMQKSASYRQSTLANNNMLLPHARMDKREASLVEQILPEKLEVDCCGSSCSSSAIAGHFLENMASSPVTSPNLENSNYLDFPPTDDSSATTHTHLVVMSKDYTDDNKMEQICLDLPDFDMNSLALESFEVQQHSAADTIWNDAFVRIENQQQEQQRTDNLAKIETSSDNLDYFDVNAYAAAAASTLQEMDDGQPKRKPYDMPVINDIEMDSMRTENFTTQSQVVETNSTVQQHQQQLNPMQTTQTSDALPVNQDQSFNVTLEHHSNIKQDQKHSANNGVKKKSDIKNIQHLRQYISHINQQQPRTSQNLTLVKASVKKNQKIFAVESSQPRNLPNVSHTEQKPEQFPSSSVQLNVNMQQQKLPNQPMEQQQLLQQSEQQQSRHQTYRSPQEAEEHQQQQQYRNRQLSQIEQQQYVLKLKEQERKPEHLQEQTLQVQYEQQSQQQQLQLKQHEKQHQLQQFQQQQQHQEQQNIQQQQKLHDDSLKQQQAPQTQLGNIITYDLESVLYQSPIFQCQRKNSEEQNIRQPTVVAETQLRIPNQQQPPEEEKQQQHHIVIQVPSVTALGSSTTSSAMHQEFKKFVALRDAERKMEKAKVVESNLKEKHLQTPPQQQQTPQLPHLQPISSYQNKQLKVLNHHQQQQQQQQAIVLHVQEQEQIKRQQHQQISPQCELHLAEQRQQQHHHLQHSPLQCQKQQTNLHQKQTQHLVYFQQQQQQQQISSQFHHHQQQQPQEQPLQHSHHEQKVQQQETAKTELLKQKQLKSFREQERQQLQLQKKLKAMQVQQHFKNLQMKEVQRKQQQQHELEQVMKKTREQQQEREKQKQLREVFLVAEQQLVLLQQQQQENHSHQEQLIRQQYIELQGQQITKPQLQQQQQSSLNAQLMQQQHYPHTLQQQQQQQQQQQIQKSQPKRRGRPKRTATNSRKTSPTANNVLAATSDSGNIAMTPNITNNNMNVNYQNFTNVTYSTTPPPLTQYYHHTQQQQQPQMLPSPQLITQQSHSQQLQLQFIDLPSASSSNVSGGGVGGLAAVNNSPSLSQHAASKQIYNVNNNNNNNNNSNNNSICQLVTQAKRYHSNVATNTNHTTSTAATTYENV